MQRKFFSRTLFPGGIIALFPLLLLSGCASIIKGSAPQQVSFKTTPSDADCQITDLRTGSIILKQKSPILTPLKRHTGFFKNAKYRYSCAREGYLPGELNIASSPNGWYVMGNFIFGGLVGWLIVDPASGAMWSFTSDDITLALALPVPVSPAVEEKPGVTVTPSYFQGRWVGYYQNWEGSEQDVEITVGSRNPDGSFDTEYSWGWRHGRVGEPTISPGTIKAKGREDGEKFVFEFDNPNNFKLNSVEMTKYEGGKAKIKLVGVMYTPQGYVSHK